MNDNNRTGSAQRLIQTVRHSTVNIEDLERALLRVLQPTEVITGEGVAKAFQVMTVKEFPGEGGDDSVQTDERSLEAAQSRAGKHK